MNDTLSTISGVVFLAGFAPYIAAILRRKAKPSKASWLIWAALDWIMFIGLLHKHAVNGLIVGALIGATLVAILSLRYGMPGWTALDITCAIGATAGVALWLLLDNANACIIACAITMFIGSFPTFASAWKDPKRESREAWLLYFIACVIGLLAVPQWTIAHAAVPVSWTATESIMMFLLFLRPHWK
ncbi:MAG: hypothetical protein G01um101425_749 [Candidatus Peregrinibacteria bacterium Gr01-1014_25]|nr:MAG: hypothetical protein G01um101425_749 [Candidatus Peregrinibacteria bacterium Gr01-1014_25]